MKLQSSLDINKTIMKIPHLKRLVTAFICMITFSCCVGAAGFTEQQVLDSTVANPICYLGICRTDAKLMWGPGDGTNLWYYTSDEAMLQFGSANYSQLPIGPFDNFCKSLGGPRLIGNGGCTPIGAGYQGLHILAPNAAQINGKLYNMYDGNCGGTCYADPDNRGSVVPNDFCPVGYQAYYFGSGIRHGNGDPGNGPSCEGKFLPPSLPAPPPPKRLGPQPPLTCNPINISTGNKYLAQTDYISSGNYPFSVQRSYNSQQYEDAGIGVNWQHNWLGYAMVKITATQMHAKRPDGKTYIFNLSNSVWQTDADLTDKLERLTDTGGTLTGWRYTSPDGVVETYNANGKLVVLSNRDSFSWNLTYTDDTMTVFDALGRSLSFKDDSVGNRIVKLPDGSNLKYMRITTSNILTAVVYPDTKSKTYLYENTTYNYALTGIIDENGNRYATYRYDAAGRAYDEELAPDLGVLAGQAIEHNNLVYNVDSSGNPTTTVVTDPRGSSRTYNFTTILGVVKSTGQSQPAGAGCAASAAALTYDVNGNVASRTDFKGNKTTYVYDLARNLETSRTEGLSTANGGTTNVVTAVTRTITTTYHPTWRLPLVTTEYSGGTSNLNDGSGIPTGAALRSTTNVYDTKGNITAITEADPLHSLSRTTTVTYTYSTLVSGLVVTKVIDGPRTDVSDVTTYNYYDANVTCTPSSAASLVDPITNTSPANLGCRGQLQSMTDALGHTTSYDRYNHHGQIEQMTDANGLVTTNTYDLRQRLLTRSVAGAATANQAAINQTTSLTYDGVGQVTQLTLPDSSNLNYSYDAAHRLTQVQDSLGNKVTYTLDSEGNRINEVTTDPLNVLTKTLTRSYDALNRLQQVIGVQ